MFRIFFSILLAGCVFSVHGDDTLRCGQQLMGLGDRQFEVQKACGEPDIKVVLNSVLTVNYGFIPYDEEWQYNFGPQQLMRFVRFRNGTLSSVQTGSHGFTTPSESCEPLEISAGLTTLALLGKCGAPTIIERRIAKRSYTLGPTHPIFPVGTPVEHWIYELGQNRFYRIATVIDGKVIHVERSNSRS